MNQSPVVAGANAASAELGFGAGAFGAIGHCDGRGEGLGTGNRHDLNCAILCTDSGQQGPQTAHTR